MGQDYLYLEAVRGPSVHDVRSAITRLLARKGWKAGEPDDARQIRIAALGEWVVITDLDGKEPPAVWANALSEELGGTGISARSWSDFGTIEVRRFEAGRPHGELETSFDEPMEASLDLTFLADLAPAKARRRLEKLKPKKAEHPDRVLERILELGGLPTPLDRSTELEAELHLGFYRPAVADARPLDVSLFGGPLDASPLTDADAGGAPTRVSPARALKRVKETFGRTYHVRAARADVVRAMRDELSTHGVRPRRVSTDGIEREIFLRERGEWCSIGEKHFRPRPFLPGSVSWGEALSTRLGRPVLVADADPAMLGFSLMVCLDGAEGASVDFPGCIDDVRKTADARALGGLVPPSRSDIDLRSIPVGRNDVFAPAAAMARVTNVFGLKDPLFAKPFDGIALAFT